MNCWGDRPSLCILRASVRNKFYDKKQMIYPTHAAFSAQLGTAFEVSGVAETGVSLELGAVSQTAAGSSAFSLVFFGDDVLRLGQGIHLFSHPELGDFDLFIVPLGPLRANGRMQYEAVFN